MSKKFKMFLNLGMLLNEPNFEDEIGRKKFGYKKEEEDILFGSENTEHRERKIEIGNKVYNWALKKVANTTP